MEQVLKKFGLFVGSLAIPLMVYEYYEIHSVHSLCSSPGTDPGVVGVANDLQTINKYSQLAQHIII